MADAVLVPPPQVMVSNSPVTGIRAGGAYGCIKAQCRPEIRGRDTVQIGVISKRERANLIAARSELSGE